MLTMTLTNTQPPIHNLSDENGGSINYQTSNPNDSVIYNPLTVPFPQVDSVNVSMEYTYEFNATNLSISNQSSIISDLDISPDGLIVASTTNNGVTKIYDTSSLAYITSLGSNNYKTSFSPNGNLFAITHTNGTVSVYDTNTWQIDTFYSHNYDSTGVSIISVDFSPDGSMLATGDDANYIEVRSTSDWSILDGNFHNINDVYSLSFSPDSTVLVAGGRSGDFKRISTTDWTSSSLIDTNGWITETEYSPDGKYLAVLTFTVSLTVPVVRVYNTTTWTVVMEFGTYNNPYYSSGIRFSSDSTFLYVGSGKIYNYNVPNSVDNLNTGAVITSLDISPNGEYVIVGDENGDFKVVDLVKGLTTNYLTNNYYSILYGKNHYLNLDGMEAVIGTNTNFSAIIRENSGTESYLDGLQNIVPGQIQSQYKIALPEDPIQYIIELHFNSSSKSIILNSKFYIVDPHPPKLYPEVDSKTVLVDTNFTLSWIMEDNNPLGYLIHVDAIQMETSSISQNATITYETYFTSLGSHNVSITMYDTTFNTAIHVVNITVVEETVSSPTSPTSDQHNSEATTKTTQTTTSSSTTSENKTSSSSVDILPDQTTNQDTPLIFGIFGMSLLVIGIIVRYKKIE